MFFVIFNGNANFDCAILACSNFHINLVKIGCFCFIGSILFSLLKKKKYENFDFFFIECVEIGYRKARL